MAIAILLAAGTGNRFNDSVPKQLMELDGKTLIEHSLEVLYEHDLVDEIILVHWRLFNRLPPEGTCVVHKDVNAPVFLLDKVPEFHNRFLLPNVQYMEQGLESLLV